MIRRFLVILFMLCLFPNVVPAAQTAGQADPIPWSGYWWPMDSGGLATGADYLGHPAPLEKYLLLTTGRMSGNAVDWYKAAYYDPDAEDWWGLCPAFARAAVTESYPILPSSENNIIFRVGDKKGLLTLCHDDRSGVIYASGDTPVSFHFWLLDYIGEQQKAFTADLDAGPEVWYFPVYSYEMASALSGQTEHVSVTILYASDNVLPDHIGTRERQRQYTYDLFLDAQGNITGGAWTGGSVTSHPETLSYPEVTGPLNPYLDYETIREIAMAQDDFLEMPENTPSRLVPGTYNLVLLNEDVYILAGAPGEEVVLDFTKDDSSRQAMDIEILDNDGVAVRQHQLTQYGPPVGFRLVLENPPYTISVSQADYADPNIYTLVMDLKGACVRQVPYIPKNGSWSGFSLTNGSDDPVEDVMLVTVDAAGKPLHTVLGPMDLAPLEKRMFHFDDLPIREHEYSDTDSFMLISGQPVDFVNLFAGSQGPMAGFTQNAPVSSRLIIPDVSDNMPWNTLYMTGAIFNDTFNDAPVTCSIYDAQGDLFRTVSQDIAARSKVRILPGSSPFLSMPEAGWMEITTDDSQAALFGYQYIQNTGNSANAVETGFALPVASGIMYLQHITPTTGAWQTLLTLINPNGDDNPVIIHPARRGGDETADMQVVLGPFEKRVVDVSPDFGVPAQERSILKISGSHPLAGYVSYATATGDAAAYPLLEADSFKTELVMPHSAYNNGRWWTGVGVCNPNAYPVTVYVLPYDNSGQALDLAGTYITLEPGAYEVFTVYQLFSAVISDIAYVRLAAEEPAAAEIGGFYLYGNAPTRNMEARQLVTGGSM